MKSKLIKLKKPKKFTPFKIEITCENEEDARLLYHLSNNYNLYKILCDVGAIKSSHNQKISKALFNSYEWIMILDELKLQGIKL